MSRSPRTAIAVIALGFSCTSEPVTNDDVFSLEVCPTARHDPNNTEEVIPPACKKVADHASPIFVRACLHPSIKNPAANLDLSIKASAGSWSDAADDDKSGATFKHSLTNAARGCLIAQLIPPNSSRAIQFDADLLGYRQSKFLEDLTSATPVEVELTAKPGSLTAGQSGSVDVTAKVDVDSGGLATTGTTVTFSVKTEPADAFAVASPETVMTDDKSAATTTLVVGPTATRVTVTATAAAPGIATTKSREVVLGILPAPASADAGK